MSYAPNTILAARTYIIGRTGLNPAAVGIVGDVAHGGEGYHSGWDGLRLAYGRDDYSVSESPRDGNPTDAAMALDIGEFKGWLDFNRWLVAQCKAGAADTQDIREVIYTLGDGVVRRWDRLGVRSGGDDSHLFHTHLSYFRDSEGKDKTALFRRYFEGGSAASEDDDDMGFITRSGPVGPNTVKTYGIPPANPVVVSLSGDIGNDKAKFRVVAFDGNGNVLPLSLYVKGKWDAAKPELGPTITTGVSAFISVKLGTRSISVQRVPADKADKADKHVDVSIEILPKAA